MKSSLRLPTRRRGHEPPVRVCTKPPVRIRLKRSLWQAVNRQAAGPRGPFGLLLGWIWSREHAALNAEVIDVLAVRPGHRVADVGCGPGQAVRMLAAIDPSVSALGLDTSALMTWLTRARNRSAVARGQVVTLVVTPPELPVEPASVDRIMSVHSIYFWPDQRDTLARLVHALAPGGRLVLAFRPDGADIPARFRDRTYTFPRTADLEGLLGTLGLTDIRSTHAHAAPEVVLLGGRLPG